MGRMGEFREWVQIRELSLETETRRLPKSRNSGRTSKAGESLR